jgi:predicted RNA-binding protein with PIN domain
MLYLVDGNNVMALKPGWHRDKAEARRRLIYELSALVAARRVKVRVVFDGAPDEDFPDGARYKSVHIFYAELGSNADTRIKDMVRSSSFKRDMVVVSSDRDLSSFAHRQGAKTMASEQFRRVLNAARASRAAKEPSRGNDPVDVDEWMDYFRHAES